METDALKGGLRGLRGPFSATFYKCHVIMTFLRVDLKMLSKSPKSTRGVRLCTSHDCSTL
jgi:hypothetical protein